MKLMGGMGQIYGLASRRFAKQPADIVIHAVTQTGKEDPDYAQSRMAQFWKGLNVDLLTGPIFWTETSTDIAKSGPTAVPEIICSNIVVSSASGVNIRPYVVKTIRGIRIGIFSIIANKAVAIPDGGEIIPPLEGAQKALAQLVKEKPDMIVMIADGANQEISDILRATGLVDVLIQDGIGYYKGDRETSVDCPGIKKGFHDPALIAQVHRGSLGEIEAVFAAGPRERELAGLRHRFINDNGQLRWNQYYDSDETVFSKVFDSPVYVLPDSRLVWPDATKLIYSPLEVYNLAAAVIKDETKAEIALVNLESLRSTVVGGLTDGLLADSLSDSKIVTAKIRGGDLLQLLPYIDYGTFPVAYSGNADSDRKYRLQTWLAASGIDKYGRVAGFPVRGEELYSVALPESLLERFDKLGTLKRLIDKTGTGRTVSELVVGGLLKMKAAMPVEAYPAAVKNMGAEEGFSSAYIRQVRGMLEGRSAEKPLWRLNIDNISFQFSNITVNNADKLGAAQNSKLQSTDQTLVQGSGRFASEYYRKEFSMVTSLTLAYGKLTLRPRTGAAIKNEIANQILAEEEVRYRLWRWNRFLGGGLVGPFADIGYDTEFAASAGLPLRKIWRGKTGIKLFDGQLLQDFYVAAVMERDHTYADNYTKWAYQTGFKLTVPVRRGVNWTVDGSYRRYYPNQLRLSDLKEELELNSRLGVDLFSNLRVSPFVSFYQAEGAFSEVTAYNLLFGISLEYSKLFKLKY